MGLYIAMLRCLLLSMPPALDGRVSTHYRAQGSFFVPFAEAAANFLGLKPVMEGRGAMVDAGGGCQQLSYRESECVGMTLKRYYAL
jgi:hypothetical protein